MMRSQAGLCVRDLDCVLSLYQCGCAHVAVVPVVSSSATCRLLLLLKRLSTTSLDRASLLAWVSRRSTKRPPGVTAVNGERFLCLEWRCCRHACSRQRTAPFGGAFAIVWMALARGLGCSELVAPTRPARHPHFLCAFAPVRRTPCTTAIQPACDKQIARPNSRVIARGPNARRQAKGRACRWPAATQEEGQAMHGKQPLLQQQIAHSVPFVRACA